ncbi:MAG: NADH-quinone oxidoreductase subunit NuoE [Phycisphaerales bacterium]|nr:MAG: NADH-quinone oxidoreductase subunit NuoE [Phycisphaerales bacterium]
MATTETTAKTTSATAAERLAQLKTYIAETQENEHPDSFLIAVLHKAQELYGYLPVEVMDEVAEQMGIPTAHIWGVATFYHYFSLTPPGQHVISICLGTACYVRGAGQILQALKDELKIDVGEVTPDGMFSLQPARCLGACGLAPVVMIDDKIHGELTPKRMVQLINQYRKQAKK